jgi:hypothetical protein
MRSEERCRVVTVDSAPSSTPGLRAASTAKFESSRLATQWRVEQRVSVLYLATFTPFHLKIVWTHFRQA